MKFDEENKVARVSLRAPELLAILNQREADNPTGNLHFLVLYSRFFLVLNEIKSNQKMFMSFQV